MEGPFLEAFQISSEFACRPGAKGGVWGGGGDTPWASPMVGKIPKKTVSVGKSLLNFMKFERFLHKFGRQLVIFVQIPTSVGKIVFYTPLSVGSWRRACLHVTTIIVICLIGVPFI